MLKGEYYFAKTTADLLQQVNAVPNAHIMGGCTLDAYIPAPFHAKDANEKNIFISIRGIKELSQIIKHERYIDCGPGVTLSSILEHSGGHIPSVLAEAAQSIANPFIRNLATIGGNIASVNQHHGYMTLCSPLLALDTKVELKSRADTRSIPLAAFEGVPKEYIISNIRIPLDDWDVAMFYRLSDAKSERPGGAFTFLAATEKHLISNVRLSFAGNAAFRSLETENRAIGMRLPLSQKDVDAIIEIAKESFKDSAKGKESDDLLDRLCYLTKCAFEQLL